MVRAWLLEDLEIQGIFNTALCPWMNPFSVGGVSCQVQYIHPLLNELPMVVFKCNISKVRFWGTGIMQMYLVQIHCFPNNFQFFCRVLAVQTAENTEGLGLKL